MNSESSSPPLARGISNLNSARFTSSPAMRRAPGAPADALISSARRAPHPGRLKLGHVLVVAVAKTNSATKPSMSFTRREGRARRCARAGRRFSRSVARGGGVQWRRAAVVFIIRRTRRVGRTKRSFARVRTTREDKTQPRAVKSCSARLMARRHWPGERRARAAEKDVCLK